MSQQSQAQVVPVSVSGRYEDGAYQKQGGLYFRDEYLLDADEVRLPGQYNLENALAAIAAAKLAGVENAAIVKVLRTFGGVRHRNQYVLTAQQRMFYNDSKATDIEATEMALSSFKKPVVLIAGGLDRGYTFEKLEPALRQHVVAMVVFGETAELLATAGQHAQVGHIKHVANLDEAVVKAYELSKPGEIILLSPASASWDQFTNFEERGNRFVADVSKLTGKKEE